MSSVTRIKHRKMRNLSASEESLHPSKKLQGTERLAALKPAEAHSLRPSTPRAELVTFQTGSSRSGARACQSVTRGELCQPPRGANPAAALRAPAPPSTQPPETAPLALRAALGPPRSTSEGPLPRGRRRRGTPARPGPARPAAKAAYLGAAVEGGLAEGSAAQGADGDVVQLLLLAGQAAAAAGAAPARGLAAEVGADGVAVPLVLAQRHGGGAAPLRPGSPSARPREPDGLHVGSRRRPGTASSCRRRDDLRAPAPRRGRGPRRRLGLGLDPAAAPKPGPKRVKPSAFGKAALGLKRRLPKPSPAPSASEPSADKTCVKQRLPRAWRRRYFTARGVRSSRLFFLKSFPVLFW